MDEVKNFSDMETVSLVIISWIAGFGVAIGLSLMLL